MSKKIRASAIITRRDKILVVKSRYSSGKEIFLLPGGKVEDYESMENAVIREVKEETNLDIAISNVVAYTEYIDKHKEKDVLEIIHSGKILHGKETHLNDPSDKKHVVGLEWMTYEELCKKEFYPKDALKHIKIILTI